MRPATFWDFAIASTAGNVAAYIAGRVAGEDPMRREPAKIAAFWLVGGLVFAGLVGRSSTPALAGSWCCPPTV